MLTLFILFIIAMFFSFVFSGSETGFISLNPLKVTHAATQGNGSARIATRLMNYRGQLLSSILVGNNICNIAVTLIFAELFLRINSVLAFNLAIIPSPESWILTPLMLLFCEIVPKTLYRTHPFILTMKSAHIVAFFFYAVMPLFWVFRLVSKIFGGKGNAYDSESASVREEIVQIAMEGAKRGHIFDSADNILKNTLDMKGKRVSSIATSIDAWKKEHAVYTVSQMTTEFRHERECTDEVIIFDDAQKTVAGYATLLDIAASRKGLSMKTFGSLIKPIERLNGNMEILTCIRRTLPNTPRYRIVTNGDETVGILDKMTLFKTAFSESQAATATFGGA